MNVKKFFGKCLIAALALLTVSSGDLITSSANATPSDRSAIVSVSAQSFVVAHESPTDGKTSGISGVISNSIPGGDGSSSCGNGAPNTGWENLYASDGTALLQMCSFDAGYHTMVTQIRIYNYYPQDPISTAYALATYDDGAHDADNRQVGGTASQANMEVQHTFTSGGLHKVTLEGGFYSYKSRGYWKQSQSLTLN